MQYIQVISVSFIDGFEPIGAVVNWAFFAEARNNPWPKLIQREKRFESRIVKWQNSESTNSKSCWKRPPFS